MLSKLRALLKPKEPGDAAWEARFQQAQALQKDGKLEQAIELYSRCIEESPQAAEPHYKRANALNTLGRLEPALEDYNRALSADPSHAYAACNRGSVLQRLGRNAEALVSLDLALQLNSGDAFAHYNRGNVLKELERYDEAVKSYDAALSLNTNFAPALVNRGAVLQKQQQNEAALDSFQRALALNPNIAEAVQGCALSLLRLQRGEEALAAFNKAITLQPQLAAAYVGRGTLLQSLDRHSEAVVDYRKALTLEPAAKTHNVLATSLLSLKQHDEAIAHLDRGIALDPELEYLPGNRLSTKLWAAIWDGFDADVTRLVQGIEARKPVCSTLTLTTVSDSPALLRTVAEVWVRNSIEPRIVHSRSQLPDLIRRARADKIRIAYFSSDLRAHPVAFLTAGLFEHHDRSQFEVTAFAFGPQTNDPIVARLEAAFDRFVDVRQKTDLEVVRLARECDIDIAIDLNGYTAHERSGIFALRAAPIQVSFLGFPGTQGAPFMDYLIADEVVIPPALQAHYAEKIAYLPDCFMPCDASSPGPNGNFTRAQQGLPADAIVFCCFNGTNKVLPDVFASWMRILQAMGDSVLWLQRAEDTVARNLRQQASARGIDPNRLIFAQRMETVAEHLARLQLADLFLDTFPYNAHSTAVDSLRSGVPLLTLPGSSFASRVAASLLRRVGLPELIAESRERYEALAISLAGDTAQREHLRRKVSEGIPSLLDTEQYTRNLEALFLKMVARHEAGEPPAHIGRP